MLLSVAKGNTPYNRNASARKRLYSLNRDNRFKLPKAIKSGVRVYKYVAVAKRRYLPSNVVIVRSKRKDPLLNLIIVRSFLGPNIKEKLYKFNKTSYIIFKFIAYSLYYVAGNPLFNKIYLAILNGLTYLVTKELEYSSLSYLNILIYPYRDMKIEYYHTRLLQNAKPRDIRALSNIIIELIQGYVKEERAISPPNSNAARFLFKTTFTTSVIKLIKQKEVLTGLVSFTTIRARIGYKYPLK
ncbi:hypothetical protein V2W45_1466043 [Cenococcum geophilum]